jgi:hypothetical protein
MARQTQLGERLAQGQAGAAQQSFRNMNTQYGMALSPQQAQSILSTNNPRDIQAFGGMNKLANIAGIDPEDLRNRTASSQLNPNGTNAINSKFVDQLNSLRKRNP